MEGPRGPGALVQLWFTAGGVWRGGEDAPLDLPRPPRGWGWVVGHFPPPLFAGIPAWWAPWLGAWGGLRERGWGQRGSRKPWSLPAED